MLSTLCVAAPAELSAEQRAILELLILRRRSYDDVADTLALSRAGVAGMARETLSELTPATAGRVPAAERDLIADYLVGQLGDDEAEAARHTLEHSPRARAWALAVADRLADLYAEAGAPHIPHAPGRRRPPRRAAGIAAVAAVALAVALATGLVGGGGKGKRHAAAPPRVVARLESAGQFKPTSGETVAGSAGVYIQRGQHLLVVQAQLKPSTATDAYEVWLYNSPSDARPVGAASAGAKGLLQGQARIAADFTRFHSIAFSRERTGVRPVHPAHVVALAALTKR